jgi:hypothetical protein
MNSSLETAINDFNAWEKNPSEENLQELEESVEHLSLDFDRSSPPVAIHALGQNAMTTAWLFARFLRGGQNR